MYESKEESNLLGRLLWQYNTSGRDSYFEARFLQTDDIVSANPISTTDVITTTFKFYGSIFAVLFFAYTFVRPLYPRVYFLRRVADVRICNDRGTPIVCLARFYFIIYVVTPWLYARPFGWFDLISQFSYVPMFDSLYSFMLALSHSITGMSSG